jgi:predicted RNase H-like HicB family nuclease
VRVPGEEAVAMKLVVKIFAESAESYCAKCPALPGCVVRGRSCEEVQARIEEAVRGYLASMDGVPTCQLELTTEVVQR